MRTIKFRAWDKTAKLMCNVLELHFPNEDGSGVTTDNYQGSFERFELMQYTGLKDKNGKEIYEGDIVKGYFKVEEVEDYIFLGLTDKEKKQGVKLFVIEDIFYPYTNPIPDEIEVIGNIYENKKLLK